MVVLAQMVSQAQVDTFYLALSIFGALALFADFGFRGSIIRYVPYFLGQSEKTKINMLLKIAYLSSTILAIIVSAIIFFYSEQIADFFIKPDLAEVLRLFSPYLLLTALFYLNGSFLNGMKRIRDQSVLLVFQNGSKLVLTLALIFFLGANLFSLTIAFLLSMLVAIVFSLFLLKKPFFEIASEKKEKEDYSSLLRDVLPFGIMISIISSFWMLINYTDRIMIGYFLPEGAVAIYTFATSLAMLIMIFPSAITAIFFPLVSGLFGEGKKDEMKNVALTSVRWLLFIIMPLALVLLAFPETLLDMFYGSDYSVGGIALAIFTLGLLIRSLSIMHALVLAGMRLVRIEIKVAAISASANVLLNLIMIPLFGIEGAAAASACAFATATFLFVHYVKREVGFGIPNSTIKSLIAGFIALLLIFLIKPYLLVAVDSAPDIEGIALSDIVSKVLKLFILGILFIIASLFYVFLLFILKTFDEEDVNLLAAALRRAKIPEKWVETISRFFLLGAS
jgi:O-antigen/teichoic acid export membrane protein